MIKRIFNRVFRTGTARNVNIKKNIAYIFVLKIISSLIGFLLIPLTINYVSPAKYGVWLTLLSIVGWFSMLDFGLGMGFRNKFAEALAKKDYEKGRIYLSTTMAIITPTIVIFFVIFIFINSYLNWGSILNATQIEHDELNITVILVFLFFCLRFIFGVISVVLVSDQKPALSNLLETVSSLIILAIIFILTKTVKESLILLSLTISAIPVVIAIIASIYFFSKDYKYLIPSFKYIKINEIKELFTLGVRFFIIQISVVFTLSLNNLLFSQFFNPEAVTEYNIVYKYLGIPTLLMTIIITPIWAATTEAFTKNDFEWVKNSMRKYLIVFSLILCFIFAQVIFSSIFYKIWIGNQINISFSMTITVAIYILFFSWNTLFNTFIFGTGKISLLFILTMIGAIIYFPLVLFFIKILNMGIISIVIANIIFLLPISITSPIQFKKIFTRRDNGIWSK